MPKIDLPTLPKLLHAFFHEWLVEQRNASHRTVLAYRDAWRLFLRFVAQRRNKPVAALDLEHLTGAEVLAFLQHIEQERRASVNTRNCRLAALRSFFSFVADYEPRAAKQCAEVLRVPFKRTTRRAIRYLDSAEVSAILSQPDRSTVEGQRDHALMSLLYNTGARIQEALDLRPQDIHLKSPAHVRLMGKGRKERISPIWPETAALITALMQRQPRKPDEPIFVNRYRSPLTASGFRFRLRQYVKAAAEGVPTISKKRVTPHLFRHSTAVHLVAAGVDVTVIRSWLGHAHLDTTNHYAQANLETKRKALEQVDPKLRPAKPPRWKRDADLLAWLDSL
ncbi:MAG: tyrosine-type recombinase/integrase [Bryobacteraceae bacterium]|jgi:site-specific recombinase XerD